MRAAFLVVYSPFDIMNSAQRTIYFPAEELNRISKKNSPLYINIKREAGYIDVVGITNTQHTIMEQYYEDLPLVRIT